MWILETELLYALLVRLFYVLTRPTVVPVVCGFSHAQIRTKLDGATEGFKYICRGASQIWKDEEVNPVFLHLAHGSFIEKFIQIMATEVH